MKIMTDTEVREKMTEISHELDEVLRGLVGVQSKIDDVTIRSASRELTTAKYILLCNAVDIQIKLIKTIQFLQYEIKDIYEEREDEE